MRNRGKFPSDILSTLLSNCLNSISIEKNTQREGEIESAEETVVGEQMKTIEGHQSNSLFVKENRWRNKNNIQEWGRRTGGGDGSCASGGLFERKDAQNTSQILTK